jgi:hypothetical protein
MLRRSCNVDLRCRAYFCFFSFVLVANAGELETRGEIGGVKEREFLDGEVFPGLHYAVWSVSFMV